MPRSTATRARPAARSTPARDPRWNICGTTLNDLVNSPSRQIDWRKTQDIYRMLFVFAMFNTISCPKDFHPALVNELMGPDYLDLMWLEGEVNVGVFDNVVSKLDGFFKYNMEAFMNGWPNWTYDWELPAWNLDTSRPIDGDDELRPNVTYSPYTQTRKCETARNIRKQETVAPVTSRSVDRQTSGPTSRTRHRPAPVSVVPSHSRRPSYASALSALPTPATSEDEEDDTDSPASPLLQITFDMEECKDLLDHFVCIRDLCANRKDTKSIQAYRLATKGEKKFRKRMAASRANSDGGSAILSPAVRRRHETERYVDAHEIPDSPKSTSSMGSSATLSDWQYTRSRRDNVNGDRRQPLRESAPQALNQQRLQVRRGPKEY